MAARKYSKKTSDTVGEEMHEFKRGQLKSGRSGRKVTSRKQAIAIGLSEARAKGEKVPAAPKGSASAKKSAKKSSAKKAAAKKSAAKKSTATKTSATKKTATRKSTSAKKTSAKKSATKKSSSKKSSS